MPMACHMKSPSKFILNESDIHRLPNNAYYFDILIAYQGTKRYN